MEVVQDMLGHLDPDNFDDELGYEEARGALEEELTKLEDELKDALDEAEFESKTNEQYEPAEDTSVTMIVTTVMEQLVGEDIVEKDVRKIVQVLVGLGWISSEEETGEAAWENKEGELADETISMPESVESEEVKESYGNVYIEADIEKGLSKEDIIRKIQDRYSDITDEQAAEIYAGVVSGKGGGWPRRPKKHEGKEEVKEEPVESKEEVKEEIIDEEMTEEEAKDLLGDRATWELKKMKKALEMLSVLNTPEDTERLAAVKVLLKGKN